MTSYYTENLADFGYREIEMLRDLLNAWVKTGLPDNFDNCGVKPAMNMSSGYVFLVNDEYQCAMLNGNTLEIYHNLPYGGAEGFLSDLFAENKPDDLHSDDIEYLLNAAEVAGYKLTPPWSELNNEPALDID